MTRKVYLGVAQDQKVEEANIHKKCMMHGLKLTLGEGKLVYLLVVSLAAT